MGCVTSTWCKRVRTGQKPCAANDTQDFGTGRNPTGNGKRAEPPERQRSGEDPASRSTSYNNLVWRSPHRVRFSGVGFFGADSEHPAHLSQLLLRAGDVEKNPGPHWCGICGTKATSNCIRCTWCGKWIHQKCSGLSSIDIKKIAKSTSYGFECSNCNNERLQELEKRETERREKEEEERREKERKEVLRKERKKVKRRNHFTCLNPGQGQPLASTIGTRTGQENPACQPQVAKQKNKGTRRGKNRRPTEEMKQARRDRRKAKRIEKRTSQEPQHPTKPKMDIKLTTWNLQGVSMHERNRGRLRRVATYVHRKGWEIVLITELRAKSQGVVWLGEEDTQTAIIHSEKCGVLLTGEALTAWIQEGQWKSYNERTVAIETHGIRIISTYQPLWSNGQEGVDRYRYSLTDEIARTPNDKILVIGGDHNAHIGRERTGDTNGRYGLCTPTTEAGEDLLDWCGVNDLQWVNSYYNVRKRGTWFNKSHRNWYELDGFLMRRGERHQVARRLEIVNEFTLSDHKPVTLHLRIPEKKRKTRQIRNPNINWERLKDTKTAERYREKTEELGQNITEESSWSEIANALCKAALAVCGKKTRHVANPWTVGREEELNELHEAISKAVSERNEALARDLPQDIIMRKKSDLKTARGNMKKRLKTLESEWWEKILEECLEANEKGDIGSVYRILKQLGSRTSKPNTGTTLTTKDFKEHFERVSKDRYEVDPVSLFRSVHKMADRRNDPKAIEGNEFLNRPPTSAEILKCITEIRSSAPGKDNVRIDYIKFANEKLQEAVIAVVKKMFNERAPRWDEILKSGQIVPLHKKGSINDPNKYRGVCLLAMGSRILAKVLTKRLRRWAESLGLLDENQNGFRTGRSTADATQILVRITEDTEDLRRRREKNQIPKEHPTDPEARLLDLTKAYPRVNKPAMWEILRRNGMQGNFLNSLIDLHESTKYQIRGKDENSEEWLPDRGLREGCSTSPCLFNIYHQVVMRLAEQERKRVGDQKYGYTGIKWKWIPGNNIPDINKIEKPNSEAKEVLLTLSLFADDTTPLGETREMPEGVDTMKKVMAEFEERNNDDKEERALFGSPEAEEIRMLGCWLGNKEDLKNRIKRAGMLWTKCRERLRKSKLPKRKQALIVETCVESGLLFDCATRPWYGTEIKKLQSWIDKRYRYIWSNKKGPPLMQMERDDVNMQDIRNLMNIKTLRWKIEKRTLERIGHILRMENSRTTKIATLGWLASLEELPKLPGHKRKTLFYWRKLLKEAGVNWSEAPKIAQDRKQWKKMVNTRMQHLLEFEMGKAKHHQETIDRRNTTPPRPSLTCEECGMECKSMGGLKIHIKRIHTDNNCTFECPNCNRTFNAEATMKNHLKKCNPADERSRARIYQPEYRECRWCGIPKSATNMSRHENFCKPLHEPQNAHPSNLGGMWSLEDNARGTQTRVHPARENHPPGASADRSLLTEVRQRNTTAPGFHPDPEFPPVVPVAQACAPLRRSRRRQRAETGDPNPNNI